MSSNRIQTHRAEKAAKQEHNKARFAELQEENAKRVANLSSSPNTSSTHGQNTTDEGRRSSENLETESIPNVEPPAYESVVDEGKGGKGRKGFRGLLKREKEGPRAKEYGVVR